MNTADLARFKIHLVRVWSVANIPVQLIQIGLLIYLSIKQSGNTMFWWVLPFFAAIIIAVWWFDVKHLITAESAYATEVTPAWKKLNADMEEIKARMRNLEEKP